ncbi:MAG: hypothetical protein WCR04_05805 [Fibrobacteraceae bacterium]
MNFIIDSCVWLDSFIRKREEISSPLIDNAGRTNDAILSEMLPSAKKNREADFIECLSGIDIMPLAIDRDEEWNIQYECLESGINKIGILDIVIAQNAVQNGTGNFSTDRPWNC